MTFTTNRRPATYRPQLVILEDRSQPGSALSGTLGWSMLDSALSFLSPATFAADTLLMPVQPAAGAPGKPPLHSDDSVAPPTPLPDLPAPSPRSLTPSDLTRLTQPADGVAPASHDHSGDYIRTQGFIYIDAWYNGDFDERNGLANESNTFVRDSRVYDDFDNYDDDWYLCIIYSNDLMNFKTDRANWEIRANIAAHSGGIVVASGTNFPAVQIPTGRSGFGLPEYRIEVEIGDLNIQLPRGKYWLNVTPVGAGIGRSFLSTTSGLNAIGSPPGNNGNSFIDSLSFGLNFEPTPTVLGKGTWDFSEGVVIMQPAPTPAP
jgi:hypothetical protein